MRGLASFLLAITFLFSPLLAQGVTSVVGSPTPATISAKGGPVSLTWRVERTEIAGPIIRTTSSTNASLVINGFVVSSFGGMLSKSGATLATGEMETLTFRESLIVPPVIARRIANAAPGTAAIRRVFSDTLPTDMSFDIPVYPSLGSTGSLLIRRIMLSFENQARTDVVRQNDQIRAVADISFRNNGILRGEWRVVDATASLGSRGKRVLQVVRQNLVSSGEGRKRIVSPPLPTQLSGLHLVSFFIEEDSREFEIPILRYFVLQDGLGEVSIAKINVGLIGPPDGASLNKNTVFSWSPVNNSVAYRVELFKQIPGAPVSGKLVPGKDNKLSLTELSLGHLQSGKSYQWQVRAFNKEGKVIGLSEPRKLIYP